MSEPQVLLERRGHVALITLNRPTVANSISSVTLAELSRIEGEIKTDEAVRAVVITGAGKHFCAGMDLAEALAGAPAAVGARFGLHRLPQPVIAAINGSAMGGGCELALACDIRFAADNAKIGLPEVQFGELPLLGGTARLGRLIGASAAKRMILTGDSVDAQTALRLGLVDEVCAAGDLLNAAIALAEKIAGNAAFAVRTGKSLIDRAMSGDIDEALDREQEEVLAMASEEERREARRIAAERSPVYAKLFRD